MKRTCIKPGCTTDISDLSARCRLCFACVVANAHDPVKLAAHTAVGRARRHGLLADPRTLPCMDCGGKAIEYDHREYAKPLDVDPVCRSCNLKRGPAVDSMAFHTSLIRPAPRRSKSLHHVEV